MSDWAARSQVWRLLVVIAAGLTFVAVLFAGQWLLPGVVDWVAARTTAGWATSALAKLRDDGAWALAGVAATGVLSAGLLDPRDMLEDPGSAAAPAVLLPVDNHDGRTGSPELPPSRPGGLPG